MTKDLVIIGGGAAGFFCAINAARMNASLRVTILEKSGKLLSKVKVSGGGRCNVTHACFEINEMVKKYPRGGNFVKKTFHQFFTTDTISWFEERGVRLKAEEDGRMFPITDSSQTIIDCLMKEADRYNVIIKMNTDVRSIQRMENRWQMETASGHSIIADQICIASGGYPKPGMFEWITKLGHSFESPVPSLFTFNIPAHPITALMGVAVPKARVRIQGSKLEQEGPLLITHWGLSGPAILRLSAWGARELAANNWQFSIYVNWLPGFNEQTLKERFRILRFDVAAQKLQNKNPFALPQRLWEFIVQQSGVRNDIRWADLPAKDENKLIRNLCASEFEVKGKTTFKEEFVTAGGIKLGELDANTMESKLQKDIFFAGEVIDVDGITGGFNFQNAWTSGFIAAKSIAAR